MQISVCLILSFFALIAGAVFYALFLVGYDQWSIDRKKQPEPSAPAGCPDPVAFASRDRLLICKDDVGCDQPDLTTRTVPNAQRAEDRAPGQEPLPEGLVPGNIAAKD